MVSYHLFTVYNLSPSTLSSQKKETKGKFSAKLLL